MSDKNDNAWGQHSCPFCIGHFLVLSHQNSLCDAMMSFHDVTMYPRGGHNVALTNPDRERQTDRQKLDDFITSTTDAGGNNMLKQGNNSFQKWLRILFWLIILMNFETRHPVSYLSHYRIGPRILVSKVDPAL